MAKGKRRDIDNEALLKMIEEGAEQTEILKTFGFKNATQLKVAYMNALMDAGKATKIKGAGGRKTKPVSTKVKVNKRGSLIIPKVLVESLKIKEAQEFDVKKTAAGITLKTVKEGEAKPEDAKK